MDIEPTIKYREQRWANALKNGQFFTYFAGHQFRGLFGEISTNVCSPKTNRISTSTTATYWTNSTSQKLVHLNFLKSYKRICVSEDGHSYQNMSNARSKNAKKKLHFGENIGTVARILTPLRTYICNTSNFHLPKELRPRNKNAK